MRKNFDFTFLIQFWIYVMHFFWEFIKESVIFKGIIKSSTLQRIFISFESNKTCKDTTKSVSKVCTMSVFLKLKEKEFSFH